MRTPLSNRPHEESNRLLTRGREEGRGGQAAEEAEMDPKSGGGGGAGKRRAQPAAGTSAVVNPTIQFGAYMLNDHSNQVAMGAGGRGGGVVMPGMSSGRSNLRANPTIQFGTYLLNDHSNPVAMGAGGRGGGMLMPGSSSDVGMSSGRTNLRARSELSPQAARGGGGGGVVMPWLSSDVGMSNGRTNPRGRSELPPQAASGGGGDGGVVMPRSSFGVGMTGGSASGLQRPPSDPQETMGRDGANLDKLKLRPEAVRGDTRYSKLPLQEAAMGGGAILNKAIRGDAHQSKLPSQEVAMGGGDLLNHPKLLPEAQRGAGGEGENAGSCYMTAKEQMLHEELSRLRLENERLQKVVAETAAALDENERLRRAADTIAVDAALLLREKGINLKDYFDIAIKKIEGSRRNRIVEMVELPTKEWKPKMTDEGCAVLSSWMCCFTGNHFKNRSWDGKFDLSSFVLIDGKVHSVKATICRLARHDERQADCLQLASYIKKLFCFEGSYPPYLLHLIKMLEQLKEGPLTLSHKAVLECHPSFFTTIGRNNSVHELKVLLDGLLPTDRKRFIDAIDIPKLDFVWLKNLRKYPIFVKIIDWGVEEEGSASGKDKMTAGLATGILKMKSTPYTKTNLSAFHLIRNFETHVTKNSLVDGKRIYKCNDGMELMIPLVLNDFMADIIGYLLEHQIPGVEQVLRNCAPSATLFMFEREENSEAFSEGVKEEVQGAHLPWTNFGSFPADGTICQGVFDQEHQRVVESCTNGLEPNAESRGTRKNTAMGEQSANPSEPGGRNKKTSGGGQAPKAGSK